MQRQEEKDLNNAKRFYLIVGILGILTGIATMNMPDDVQANFNLTEGAWVVIGWMIVILSGIFIVAYITLKQKGRN